jgi:hypothetical protein
MFQSASAPVLRCALWLSPLFLGLTAQDVSAAAAVSPKGPIQGTSAQVVSAAQQPVSARVNVVQGRSVLVTQSADPMTLRRGESLTAVGNAQLEVAAGCQVQVSIDGEMTLDVFGPSSVEWRGGEGGAGIVFHQLGWADVDVRGGQHKLKLNADWHADFGRSSFHLRSLSGGPTELRHNAGVPISLEWLGDTSRVRPPVTVYAGSSVRLDRPRFEPTETSSASQDATKAWQEGSQGDWPWRERTDSSAQVREREVLGRESQALNEIPGTPEGQFARLRAYEADGTSSVRPLRRRRDEGQTYAQVPIMPLIAPKVEIVTRPVDSLEQERVTVPRRPSTDPVPVPETISTPAPVVTPSAPVTSGSASVKVDVADVVEVPQAKAVAPVVFDKSQWRGLAQSSLNGVNDVVAERGSGVEVRVLGAGRTKVFVSASSPSARWCFTPTADLLMSPGSVAVFEENGDLRMSFGDIAEKAPMNGRPAYSVLAK